MREPGDKIDVWLQIIKWVNFRYVQEAAKTWRERGPVRTICYLEPIIFKVELHDSTFVLCNLLIVKFTCLLATLL